jgi:ABC-2 type transport system ATP-binding protein
MDSILRLNEVRKTYEKKVAVDNVSFEVPRGSIFGLLGPNGAGKTSLIRIITTIIRADSGQVFIDGEKLHSNHPYQIGYMPEERGLYRKMKVGEHLLYLAQLKNLSKTEARTKIDEWLERFEITDWWDKKVEELSKGMQQKIQFIATVVHQPKLLILDEPFSGLDPLNTNLIKSEIHNLREQGTSIIFSTHRMEQVEEICEHIVLINNGNNVLEGEVATIKEQFKDHLYRLDFVGAPPTSPPPNSQVVEQSDKHLLLQLQDGGDARSLLGHFVQSGTHIIAFNEILPSLNEIFIRQVQS